MKAISLKQPWANLVASGQKTLETRTWPTKFRGDLLIVSSQNPKIPPAGFALAIVEVVECRLMTKADEKAACCKLYTGAWVWELKNIRRIRPFPVKGKLSFYDVELPEER